MRPAALPVFLVTGADGQLGRQLVVNLLQSGACGVIATGRDPPSSAISRRARFSRRIAARC